MTVALMGGLPAASHGPVISVSESALMSVTDIRRPPAPERAANSVSRHSAASRSFVACIGLVLAACGGSGGEGAQEPVAGQQGGTITIGMAWDSDTPLQSQRTGVNMCEPLVRLNGDFTLQPLLATSWERRGENTFRMKLRQGVTFHDGTPFTAEAVRFSLQQTVEKGLYNSTGLGTDSVSVVDDLTVDITPAEPNLRIIEQLGHPGTNIVRPGSDPSKGPICTGPFRFDAHVPDVSLTVSRYDGYWGERAKLDSIVVKILPDNTTRALALRSGDVDMIKDVPAADVGQLEAAGFDVTKAPAGATLALAFNIERTSGVLADLTLRRALALALDRRAIVDGPLGGEGEFVQVLGSPGVLGPHVSRVKGIAPDVSQASSLLDRAGWTTSGDGVRQKEGRRLALTLLAHPTVNREAMQLLQVQAKRVGFDISLQFAPDVGAYGRSQPAGEWDLLTYVTNQGDANPAQKTQTYVSGERFGMWSRPGGRFDELAAQANTAPTLEESQRLSAESQRVLIEEHVAILPIAGISRIWAAKSSVTGFSPHPNWLYQYWESVGVST